MVSFDTECGGCGAIAGYILGNPTTNNATGQFLLLRSEGAIIMMACKQDEKRCTRACHHVSMLAHPKLETSDMYSLAATETSSARQRTCVMSTHCHCTGETLLPCNFYVLGAHSAKYCTSASFISSFPPCLSWQRKCRRIGPATDSSINCLTSVRQTLDLPLGMKIIS